MFNRLLRVILFAGAIFLSLLAFYLHPVGSSFIPLFLPLCWALLLGFSCFILGRLLLSLSNLEHLSIATAAAVGWIACSAFFFLFAAIHWVGNTALIIFLLLPFGLSLVLKKKWSFWCASVRALRDAFKAEPSAWFILLLPLIYAFLPPTWWDTLVYHLGIPNQIIQWGGFIATPFHVYANSSIYNEVAMIPSVLLGDRVPALVHLLLGVALLQVIVDFAREKLAITRQGLVLTTICCLPMTLFLLATQKNDLISALFVMLAIQHWDDRPRLASVFWGFALGVKSFNLVPLLAFFLVSRVWRSEERCRWLQLLWIAPLLLIPLLLKNIFLTGNPVYPFLSHIFPSSSWNDVRQAAMQIDVGAAVKSVADIFRFPIYLLYRSFGYGGLVGPLPLVFLPLLLVYRELANRRTLWFALLTIILAAPLTDSMRFVYIAFILLALWSLKVLLVNNNILLKGLFILLVGLNFVQGFILVDSYFPIKRILTHQIDADKYITNSLKVYPLFKATSNLPKNSRIMLIGESRNFYLKRPYVLSSGIDAAVILPYLRPAISARDFLLRLHRDKFTHLIIDPKQLQSQREEYNTMSLEEERRFLKYCREWKPIISFAGIGLYDVGALLHRRLN